MVATSAIDDAVSALLVVTRDSEIGRSGFPGFHLPLPRWLGACASAGDRSCEASKVQRGRELFRLEAGIRADGAVIVQPRQESGAEGITGSDGVDDLDVSWCAGHAGVPMK